MSNNKKNEKKGYDKKLRDGFNNVNEEFDEEFEEGFDEDFESKIDIEDDMETGMSDEDINKFDLLFHFNTNKHKQDGKHRLKEDTIFKGKNEKKYEEFDEYGFELNNDYSDIVNFFDVGSIENTNSTEQTNLTKDVYEILSTKTDIDFLQNRRKPNKDAFNGYYNLLLENLEFKYTKSEMFVELSFYFTDNIFNMYKLLDKEPATIIIKELINKGYLKELQNINFL